MLLYCPNCQNLVDKISETRGDGDTIYRKCKKCNKQVSFFVKYKAQSKLEHLTKR